MSKKIIIAALIGIVVLGCKREFDNPPDNTIPVGDVLTIADIKALSYPHKFVGDSSLYAVVTMDESSGNLYKNIYVQDATGAINVRLFSSGSVKEGDSIRIYLRNTVVGQFSGMIQLDSVDTDDNIIKLANNVTVTPQVVTINQIDQTMQSKLVRINAAEFVSAHAGKVWADGVNEVSIDRTLTECSGVDEIIIRSSGYSNFASDITPTGNGEVIAIVTQFNTTMQLLIRTPDEVTFNDPRCGAMYVFSKDFEDGSLTSGGWAVHWNGTTTGSTNWGEWELFLGSDNAMSASNFDIASFTNYSATSWFVSPGIDLNTLTPGTPILTFENTHRYDPGAQLELYVCTDYDGTSDPETQGTWINLSGSVTWDPDDSVWDWVASGPIDLTAYKSANTYIGFRYQGSNVDGATWEIDDINIENQ
ncbi:MAG: choice-of-anchor J domain-containing protein [Flavobacteriales bacterium]|nr:choice-of-anchor J domain-containing protein [Flavobacteriales bacterium]